MSKTDRSPHVVVVGSGFGGMAAARGLRRAPVQVTIIDRSNHHLFQPLLYQVATAALSPADIAAPIRRVFRHQSNVQRDARRRHRRSTSSENASSWPMEPSITTC